MESEKKTGPRPLSFGDVFGTWIVIVIVISFLAYLFVYDQQLLIFLLIATVVLVGIPWVFTRLWNARIKRMEMRHFHED